MRRFGVSYHGISRVTAPMLPSDSRISGQHDGWPVLLVHPNPSAPLNITCDASDFAVGGVLQQCIDNVWQPLLFFIKKLAPAETRYSAFDRELLSGLRYN